MAYPIKPPPFDVSGGKKSVFTQDYVNGDGDMLIDSAAAGWALDSALRYRISSTQSLVVEVLGPGGEYAPVPAIEGDGSVGADEIVLIKGRYPGFKFTTTGVVTLIGYHTLES